MAQPTKALPIDATGRVLITEAGDTEVDSAHISVGTTPVELTISNGPDRRKLLVTLPEGASVDVVYIGGDSNVSHSSGYPLYKLDQLALDVNDDAEVWAVTQSGTTDVHIMEIE